MSAHLSQRRKEKVVTTLSVGDDARNGVTHTLLVGSEMLHSHCRKQVFNKSKYNYHVTQQFRLSHLSRRIENSCSHKNLDMRVRGSFICNGQKVGSMQSSRGGGRNDNSSQPGGSRLNSFTEKKACF